jgi:predicted dehydrogenase
VTRAASPERLRVGVVGCGSIAQIAHLPNLALLPSLFELVGVVDPSGVVARATAARWATRGFTDHRQLIADVDPDALLVAAPHSAHAEIVHDTLAPSSRVSSSPISCTTST